MTTRAEHVAFTKERSLELVGDPIGALASFQSDLLSHPDTADHPAIMLGMMLAMNGHLDTPGKVREFIEGIN